MACSPSELQVGRFVVDLLHTGSWLSQLVTDLAAARTVEHLQLADALSQRMHPEDDGIGRTYG